MPAEVTIPPKKEIRWSPRLIRRLRGKRTQSEFGAMLGAPKNTVWRWEAGLVEPTPRYAARLAEVADRERFLKDWQLVGSITLVGDLESARAEINELFQRSLTRTAKQLAD